MTEKTSKLFKTVGILAIALISILVVRKYTLSEIRALMEGTGALAPIIYIGLFSILPVFFFPVPVLVLPAGILFGVFWGTIYTLLGSLVNSILMFYTGKLLMRGFVTDILEKKIQGDLKHKLLSENQRTLGTVFFILRLIPLVSYNLINYVSGITNIKLPLYLFTTLLGILPGTVVFLNAGDKSLNMWSIEFVIAMILLIALTVASGLLLKAYLKRSKDGKYNNSGIQREG